jgi:ABC-2 type transport system permease protein
MNKKIIQKELHTLTHTVKYRISYIIFVLLYLIALADGIQYYKAENAQRIKDAKASYKQWLEQGAKNPHSAAHYGFYAYKPVSTGAILERGLDDFLGNTVWLEAHNQNEVKARSITDRLVLSGFGSITCGLLLGFFLPLLLFLWGFNMVSDEKRSGTLKLLLVSGVTPKQVLFNKALSLFIAFQYLLLPVCILPLLVLFSTDLLVTIITFYALLSLFGLVLCCITITVSSFVTNGTLSISILLGLWLVGIVIIPKLSTVIASVYYPLPTAFSFYEAVEKDKLKGVDGHNPAAERTKKFQDSVLKKYGVDSIQQLPINFAGLALQEGEENGNLIYDKHFGNLHDEFASQEKLISGIGFLSPFATVRAVLMGFAGTDNNQQISFINQAEKHRRFIQKTLNENFAKEGIGKDFATYMQDEKLWSQIPPFQFIPYQWTDIIQLQKYNLFVLLAWLFISSMVLYYSIKKFVIA